MLSRRDVLRLISLSTLAAAGGSMLAGCGDGSGGASDAAGLDLVSSKVPRAAGDADAVPGVVAALHRMGGGIFGAVGAGSGNLAISPYSIGVALALTLNGARGSTLDQMTALFEPSDVEAINGGLDALTADIDGLAGPVVRADDSLAELALSAANALFGQRDERWQQDFLDTLARSYGAGMHAVDYGTDAAGAAKEINGWTADHTGDRITDIIPAGLLDDLTRLVLVNALYLKAPWERPFAKELTVPGPFTRADGSTVQAQMMTPADEGPDQYATGDGWVATTLPYAGATVAMTVVLPDAGRSDDVQADLVGGNLPRILDAIKPGAVELALPKWTFRTQAPLMEALTSLGMTRAFDPERADFSGMTDQDQLYIKAVLHQVFIAVDEDGTEAAASTAVVSEAQSARLPAVVMKVDRPFFFAIHDVAHGTPLFLGRVMDPATG